MQLYHALLIPLTENALKSLIFRARGDRRWRKTGTANFIKTNCENRRVAANPTVIIDRRRRGGCVEARDNRGRRRRRAVFVVIITATITVIADRKHPV